MQSTSIQRVGKVSVFALVMLSQRTMSYASLEGEVDEVLGLERASAAPLA